jgi:DNA-binding response OmpR family regulator
MDQPLDFLQKPFTPTDLAATVRKMLDRRPGSPE